MRRKSRTALTVLGVIVGSCSILLMLSLGQGMNATSEASVKNMSDLTAISVNPSNGTGSSTSGAQTMRQPGKSIGNGKEKLNKSAVNDFRKIGNVVGVTPFQTLNVPLKINAGSGGRYTTDQYSNVHSQGIEMNQFEAMGYK
jgi:putative ABC transport system permease protein